MRWKRIVCAILTAGALVAGAAGPAHAIANGQTADDGEYPFSVKLTMTGIPEAGGGRRDSSCSGGLISPRWVLTAGHCFKNENGVHVSKLVARRTTATVGRADLNGDAGHEVKVVAVRQSTVADVALAQLDRDVTDIAPMRLNRAKPRLGQNVRLIGFGLLDGDDAETPDRMRVGQFTITSVDQYTLGMSGRSPRKDTSPCPKDSGGPYFAKDSKGVAVVYGVVSGGPTCPHTGADRSGRIDSVSKWILGIIGKDGPRPTKAPAKRPAAQKPAAQKPAAQKVVQQPVNNELPYGLNLPLVAGVSAVGVVAIVLMVTAGGRRNRRRRFRHRR